MFCNRHRGLYEFCFVVFILSLLLLPTQATATTSVDKAILFVSMVEGDDVTGDGSFAQPLATIQHAVDLSTNGDEIHLFQETFTGPGNRDIDLLGKELTIRSVDEIKATCIIDCQGTELEPHVGFILQTTDGSATLLAGMTITGAYGTDVYPGAITFGDHYKKISPDMSRDEYMAWLMSQKLAEQEGVLFQDLLVINNTGYGVWIYDGPVVQAEDCSFSNNTEGGFMACAFTDRGIFLRCDFMENGGTGFSNGAASSGISYENEIRECRFEQNGEHGMVSWSIGWSSPMVYDSQFLLNEEAGIQFSYHVTMFDCRLDSNQTWGLQEQDSIGDSWSADIIGGSICNNTSGGSYISLRSTEMDGVTVKGNGGPGVWLFEDSHSRTNIDFLNCLVADNRGVGIHIGKGDYNPESDWSTISFLGNTISDNDSHGIEYDNGLDQKDFVFANNIISGNGMAAVHELTLPAPLVVSNCNIYGNIGGDWIAPLDSFEGLAGNISTDPLFCDELNPDEGYTLRAYSPCTADNNTPNGQIGALGVGCESLSCSVVVEPASGLLVACGDSLVLNFKYSPPAEPVGVKGYSLRIVAPATISFSASDFVVNNLPDEDQGFYEIIENGLNDFTLDYVILGSSTLGITTPETLFSVVFHGVEEGSATVSITEADIRDLTNVSIPVYHFFDAVIEVDCTAPGVAVNAVASPGNGAVAVGWENPADSDIAEIQVYRGLWHDDLGESVYPQYAQNPENTQPAQFANFAGYAGSDEWELVVIVDSTSSSLVDEVTPRGIYDYQIFAMDAAGNCSLPMAQVFGATNYILGDIAAPCDGEVGVDDLSVLGASYGVGCGHENYNIEADIGPTVGGCGNDLPIPDCAVDFDDLMIVAFNFGGSAVLVKEKALENNDLSLAWVQNSETEWACVLVDPCPQLKGLRVVGNMEADIELGDLLAGHQSRVFFKETDSPGLDAGLAVLGFNHGVVGTGELFRVKLNDPVEILNISIEARSIANEVMNLTFKDQDENLLPTHFELAHNYPNPFNPSTTICYSLPESQRVSLVVYSVDGRRVRTLVSEVKPAGLFEAVWDGKDEMGRTVSSGNYFCRIDAGVFSDTKKMVLMK